MKRSNKRMAVILAAAMLLGGTSAALAYGGFKHQGGCDRHGMGAPMRALGQLESLSDEQRGQLKSLFRAQRDNMLETKDKMQDNRQALRDAMRKGSQDKELRSLAETQGDLVTQMILARAEMRNKVDAILTEEQRAELQQFQQEYDTSQRDGFHHEGGRW